MKLSRLAAALLLLAAAQASAADSFSFDAAPGKLPKQVVPESYDIALVPDLGSASFRGTETVAITVRAPTDRLVLNAAALEIGSARLEDAAEEASTILADAASETVTLAFAR